MTRRPSANNYVDTTDGEVYKIYTEVANAGKTIEGATIYSITL